MHASTTVTSDQSHSPESLPVYSSGHPDTFCKSYDVDSSQQLYNLYLMNQPADRQTTYQFDSYSSVLLSRYRDEVMSDLPQYADSNCPPQHEILNVDTV